MDLFLTQYKIDSIARFYSMLKQMINRQIIYYFPQVNRLNMIIIIVIILTQFPLDCQEDYNIMNRSNSYSFRSFAKHKNNKSVLRSSANCEFRTVWKYRDNHNKFCLDKSNKPKQQKAQEQQCIDYHETAMQMQMKQFIKMMKKSSQQPVVRDQSSVQQPRNIATCHSTRSSKSLAKSRCSSRMAIQRVQFENSLTLDDIQRKIQQLLKEYSENKNSLKMLSGHKVFFDSIDSQIQQLIEHVRKYRNQQISTHGERWQIEEEICDIKQKIAIIQKAIATKFVQSQNLKNQFYSKSKNRKQYAIINKSIQNRSIQRNMALQSYSMNLSQPTLHFQTQNMSNFIKPDRNSYAPQQIKNRSFVLNRQPLPRSTYQKQFLYYGIVPTYPTHSTSKVCQTAKPSQKLNLSSVQTRQTCYKNEFKQKKANLIDSRTLDCRQDKFRNVNISFMPRRDCSDKKNALKNNQKKVQRKSQAPQTKQIVFSVNQQSSTKQRAAMVKKLAISDKQNRQKLSQSTVKMNKTVFIGKTEHQREFKVLTPSLQAISKDTNLTNLKYSYRLQFQV